MAPQQSPSGVQPLPPETQRLLQQFGGRVAEPAGLDPATQALLEQFGGRVVPETPAAVPTAAPGDETTPPEGVGAVTRASRFLTPLVGSMAGATKGAAVGFAAGGPPGAFVGGLTGAAIGAGGGELLQTGFEQLFPPEGADTEARAGLVERLGRETRAGLFGEAGGRALTPVIQRALAPVSGRLETFAREAIEQFTEFTPDGRIVRVLPGEVSTSRILDVTQNIAEGSFLGGARITAVKQARQVTTERYITGILDELGPALDTRVTGQIVRGRARALDLRFRRQQNELWEEFYDVGGKVDVATPELDTIIAELQGIPLDQLTPNAGARAARRLAKALGGGDVVDEALQEAVGAAQGGAAFTAEQIAKMSPAAQETLAAARAAADATTEVPTARVFQALISQLGEIQRGLRTQVVTDTTKRQPLRLITELRTAAMADMQQALQSASPDAQEAYDVARAFTRAGHAQLHPDPVMRLMGVLDTAPEKVIDTLLRKNNGSQIQAVRNAIGDRAFRFVQTRAMREIAKIDPSTGIVNWGRLLRRMDQLTPNTIEALFPRGQAQEIQRVAQLMVDTGRRQAGGIGRMAIQLSQGGALIGLASGVLAPGAAAIFVVPTAMARILASQVGLRWLTTGLTAPIGSPLAARAAGNLLSFMMTPEADVKGETPGVAPGTTLRVDPARLGEITGQPGVRTGAAVTLGR